MASDAWVIDDAWVINDIAMAIRPPSISARIQRVAQALLKEETDYHKYYVPKLVSIGPYHNGNPMLMSVERLKPVLTKDLLSKYDVDLYSLYKMFGEPNRVQSFRDYYEEGSTDHLSDKEFTRMMLLDGCFIVHYIRFIYGEKPDAYGALRSHQIVFIHQDLLLLENQIPFQILKMVMEFIKFDRPDKFGSFFADSLLARGIRQTRVWSKNDQISERESQASLKILEADHLLHHLHSSLTHTQYRSKSKKSEIISHRYTYRSLKQLSSVGIHFKSSRVMSLAHVKFVKRHRWWLSADVELPPIIVDESTKTMLLNLIAHEIITTDEHAWVTSYICLLDSLIRQPEDVAALREAGVLDSSFTSDKEVANLINEIATDLVPSTLAYSDAKTLIENHFESWKNARLSHLIHQYVDWSLLATFGGVLGLFLSAVQAYFTVWSPKSR
ncbi:hypothetical protein L1887_04388 [Cichorium endivia]|nr:hypothetical protein L1887_04388 [Cichorium endivia]